MPAQAGIHGTMQLEWGCLGLDDKDGKAAGQAASRE
jgi:hypothetical protein